MQKILVIGAGRSSASLIKYLLGHAESEQWQLTLAEKETKLAANKIGSNPYATVLSLDVEDHESVDKAIKSHDLVISMLPARFHIAVAKSCAKFGTHFLTASYLKEDIKQLDNQFREAGKTVIMEMGLDPGIDHMSAMKVIDELKENNCELTGFETFTGGLIAEVSEGNNPWRYKFTWNPRNVVLAGQGTCKFIQEDRYKYIPYHKLFKRTEMIYIPGHGYFEGYANRDSLAYLDVYKLRGISTLYRGTLRRPGFCAAWDVFVQLGATEDTYEMENVAAMTHRQYINSFLSYNPHDSVELKLAHYINQPVESQTMHCLKWLGLFGNELVGLTKGTPAQILEHILKKKWSLDPQDRDMIVMWHKFNYLDGGKAKQIESSMVALGEDQEQTAMAKTVGLPLGIAAKKILTGEISLPGINIPTARKIYGPVLDELKSLGFEFQERATEATIQ
ncbi:MAG: saccharopine dehydrogenase C-terminal domain-containing protein [Bacteroidota bacterium]